MNDSFMGKKKNLNLVLIIDICGFLHEIQNTAVSKRRCNKIEINTKYLCP